MFPVIVQDMRMHSSAIKWWETIRECSCQESVKKNNKHRYYVTTEIIDTIEVEYNDSVIEMNYYEYKSKYVGKNIDDALLHLILLV